ncbi:hypothetical protein CK203_110025 [Vitis vinifera]|uniref:Reverse transcriptase domain-containing protein n=1 Tax=Vitis vinifera TaxID=29760 RepID=A0A438FEU8_VITVI|nr:hypothetical protein CK203_110025 [Vitis vinifera]
MGTLMIELLIGPTTFPLLFQVLRIPTSFNLLLGRPWIHRVEAIPSSLHQKISHSEDDLFFTGFTFDEVQTLEVEDFCRDLIVMSFDQHSSMMVLNMMREADYRYMARLHWERMRACLTCTPFNYPIRPYRMSLAYYFTRGSETHPHMEDFDLGDETSGAPVLVMIVHSLPDRANFLSLCFLEETIDCGVDVEPTRIVEMVQPESASPFDLFGVSTIEVVEEIQTVLTPELMEDVTIGDDEFEDTFGFIKGEFDFVDPFLLFDILSGFISCSDDVYDSVSMDLSIFKYFPVSCDSIYISTPYSLTPQILDIDDEIAQPDSDRDFSDHDSDPIDERVSPTIGDVETINFGTKDQPRELKIGSPLSTDERDRLIHLLMSYLDVFAWSYEDMSGLNLSIVQHHLPILPHVKPVKQKLRRLHPRWSLQILMAPEDMEKTTFITKWGTYCYRVMAFGLRLNPKKCTFGVTSRKLLGHMVSERGLEVDPDKIITILDMLVPRTEKEIRGFLSRLQYISHFIARLTDI